MIHFIILGIAFIMFILAIINSFILMYDKEKQYPRWLTLNWTVILIFYMAIVLLGYIGYFLYPHVINFFEYLRGLQL
jgi:hypothetical protein